MSDRWLAVGKIIAPQGLKGEVRVYPDSDFPERFVEPGQRWLLRPGATEPEPIELLKGRSLDGKGLYVVQLAGITDRTQAETLRGCQIMVPASDRLPLDPDEFHVADLIGLQVFDQATQTLIGTVTNIIPAGNDLLEVQRSPAPPNAKPLLIPFVMAIVPIVDLAHQRIEITPPAGLID